MFIKTVKNGVIGTALLSFLSITTANAVPVTGLNLGQTSTIANPLPFYCTITNANNSDHVSMKNRAVMITGFTKHGKLSTNVDKINKVYFNSYHDPKYPNQDGLVFIFVDNGKADVSCQQGVGTGRTLMPGNYGIP